MIQLTINQKCYYLYLEAFPSEIQVNQKMILIGATGSEWIDVASLKYVVMVDRNIINSNKVWQL